MAVAASSGVSVTPGTGTNTGPSPSITTPASNPVVMVAIAIWDGPGGVTITGLTITGFGGTASLVKQGFFGGGQDMTLEVWKIVGPTANTSGTVQANFSGSVDYQMHVEAFSGAHQTDPSPAADAQLSTAVTAPETLTPANLVAGDASYGAAMNRAGGADLAAVTPNGLYLANSLPSADHDMAAGYATDTTGVTFSNTAAGGNFIKVAARIAAAAAAGGAATKPTDLRSQTFQSMRR